MSSYLFAEHTPVMCNFFGRGNVNVLQSMIRDTVFDATGRAINGDGGAQLGGIMRDVYELMPSSSVDDLNKETVRRAASEIVSAMRFNAKYMRDIEQPLRYMERPLFADADRGMKSRGHVLR
jgi:Family of unknown function (DUF5761)